MRLNNNLVTIKKNIVEEKRKTLAKKIGVQPSDLLTSQEVADRLGISRVTVYNLRAKRVIKPRKHRGCVFYNHRDIDKLLTNR